ncbi:MAG: tRNA 2-selenouridine(34) synthase MnmH [Bacteroidota bacterium]
MIRTIQPINFPVAATRSPVIDVRSPGEYAQGHIPGATNIPLFNDAERAVVGTLYVKSGHPEAILKGLDIALPKVDGYLGSLQAVQPGEEIFLHCWRGGLRSEMMAEVFSTAGYEVKLLGGGYKGYRHFIREGLSASANIIVLGGFTGSGKTEILHAIAARGEQVIDLEHLACHKGSVFGAMGQLPQPTNEQFENDLFAQWVEMDFSRPVWLEDESRMIGRVTMPDPVAAHISNGLLIMVDLDPVIRIQRLVDEYAGFDRQMLGEAILKIAERLGGTRTRDALAALEDGRFGEVAAIVLAYYDKAYGFSVARRKGSQVFGIPVSGTDANLDAERIIAFSRNVH